MKSVAWKSTNKLVVTQIITDQTYCACMDMVIANPRFGNPRVNALGPSLRQTSKTRIATFLLYRCKSSPPTAGCIREEVVKAVSRTKCLWLVQVFSQNDWGALYTKGRNNTVQRVSLDTKGENLLWIPHLVTGYWVAKQHIKWSYLKKEIDQ